MGKKVITPKDIAESPLLQDMIGIENDGFIPTKKVNNTPVNPYDEPALDAEAFSPIFSPEEAELLDAPASEEFYTAQDRENLLSRDQGLGGNIVRGLGRAIVKIPEELLNAAGSIGGLAGWATTGFDKQDADYLYNNAFHKEVESAFETVRDGLDLQVHTPTKVKEGNIWDNLGSSAFWAEEGGDALGFLASFAVGGGIVKGLGVGGKVLSKGIKVGGKFITPLNKLGRNSAKMAKYMNKADELTATAFNTFSESALEAGGVYESVYDAEFRRAMTSGVSEQAADAMARNLAADRAGATFGVNAALLTLPNYIMGQNLYGTFGRSKGLMREILQTGKATGTTAKNIAGKAAIGIASEGFLEEGVQTATESYFTDLDAKVEERGILGNLKGVVDKYGDMLGDTQMHKAWVLGGMMGSVGGAIGGIREYNQAKDFVQGTKNKDAKWRNNKFVKSFLGEPVDKGIAQIFDENLLSDFTSVTDIMDRNEDGSLKIDPSKNPDAFDKLLQEKLGKDIMNYSSLQQTMADAVKNEDEDLYQAAKNLLSFTGMKDILHSDEAVDIFKEDVLPAEAKREVEKRVQQGGEANRKYYEQEVADEMEQKIAMIDVFKDMNDNIHYAHKDQFDVKNEPGDENYFGLYEGKVLNAKLQNRVLDQTYRDNMARLQKRSDKLTDGKWNESKLGALAVDDLIQVNGKEGVYIGGGEFIANEDLKIDNINSIDNLLNPKTTPIEEGAEVKMLNVNEGDKQTYVTNLADMNKNELLLSNLIKNDKKLYNNSALQKEYDTYVKEAKEEQALTEFNNAFTDDSVWKDNTGKLFKLKNDESGVQLYEGVMDSKGKIRYVNPVDIDLKAKSSEFLQQHTKVDEGGSPTEGIYYDERAVKRHMTKLVNKDKGEEARVYANRLDDKFPMARRANKRVQRHLNNLARKYQHNSEINKLQEEDTVFENKYGNMYVARLMPDGTYKMVKLEEYNSNKNIPEFGKKSWSTTQEKLDTEFSKIAKKKDYWDLFLMNKAQKDVMDTVLEAMDTNDADMSKILDNIQNIDKEITTLLDRTLTSSGSVDKRYGQAALNKIFQSVEDLETELEILEEDYEALQNKAEKLDNVFYKVEEYDGLTLAESNEKREALKKRRRELENTIKSSEKFISKLRNYINKVLDSLRAFYRYFVNPFYEAKDLKQYIDSYVQEHKDALKPGETLSKSKTMALKNRAITAFENAGKRADISKANVSRARGLMQQALNNMKDAQKELNDVNENIQVLNRKFKAYDTFKEGYPEGTAQKIGSPSTKNLDPTSSSAVTDTSDEIPVSTPTEATKTNATLFSKNRAPIDIFNPAGNSNLGRTDKLNPDPNAVKYAKFLNNANVAKGDYRMKVVKAKDLFSSDEQLFLKNVEGRKYKDKDGKIRNYKWNDVLYSIVTNKDGKYVDVDGKVLENQDLGAYNVPNKDIIYTTLALPTATISSNGTTFYNKYYTPTDVTGWKQAFPDWTSNLADKVILEQGPAHLKEYVAMLTEKYDFIRDNMVKDLDKGEEVTIPIVGKSKGVVAYNTNPQDISNFVDKMREISQALGKDFSKAYIMKNIELKVADENTVTFSDGSTEFAKPGYLYARDMNTGQFYPIQTRNLAEKEAKDIVDLLEYYANRVNALNRGGTEFSSLGAMFSEAAKVVDKDGNQPKLPGEVEGFSIFRVISDRVFYTGNNMDKNGNAINKNNDTSFYFQGNTIVYGNNKQPFLVEGSDGQFRLNRNLIDNPSGQSLTDFLIGRFHQINKNKLTDKNSQTFIPTDISAAKGYVSGNPANYKEYLLDSVIETNIATPVAEEVEFDGNKSTETGPVFRNVYPYVQYGKYGNGYTYDKTVPTSTTPPSIMSGFVPTPAEGTGGFTSVTEGFSLKNMAPNPVTTEEAVKTEEPAKGFSLTNMPGLTFTEGNPESNTTKPSLKTLFEEDSEEEAFRLKITDDYQKADVGKETKWVRSVLPEGLPLTVVERIAGAHGMVKKGAMVLAEDMEVGTAYHEAFHVVSNMILSNEERASLYKEWKEINGKDLSNAEIEEHLAEDFRDYMLSDKTLKFAKAPNSNWFFNLLSTLVDWITGSKPATIDRVFRNISKGTYSNSKLTDNGSTFKRNRKRLFNSNDPKIGGPTFFQDTMSTMDLYVFNTIRDMYQDFSLFFNGNANNHLLFDAYKQVYSKLKSELDTSTQEGFERKAAGKAHPYGFKAKVTALEYILDNFNTEIVPKHLETLRDYQLYTKEIKDQDYYEQLAGINESNRTSDTAFDGSDSSIKISPTANATSRIRLLLATIPQKVKMANGNFQYSINSIGMPYSADFATTAKVLMKEVTGVKTPEGLAERLRGLTDKIPGVEYLLSKEGLDLDNLTNPDVPSSAINNARFLEIMEFTQLYYNTENKYSSDVLLENGERRIKDANLDTQREKVRKEWQANSYINSISEGFKQYYNENKSYNKAAFANMSLSANVRENLPQSYVDFLDILGITITNPNDFSASDAALLREKARRLLTGIKAPETSAASVTANIFSSDEITNAGNDMSTIVDLEYTYTLDKTENSHLNHNGESVYNFSTPHYISETMDAINDASSLQELLKKSPHLSAEIDSYKRNSLLLKPGGLLFEDDAENGHPKKTIGGVAVTFDLLLAESSINSSNSSSKGYDKQVDAERLAFVLSRSTDNQFNLLRPADKKLERYINLSEKPVKTREEATELFIGYLKDELFRAKQAQFSNDGYSWTNLAKNSKGGIAIEALKKFHPDAKNRLKELNKFLDSNVTSETGIYDSVEKFVEQERDFIEQAYINYFIDEATKTLQDLVDLNLVTFNNNFYTNNGLNFSNKDGHIGVFTEQQLIDYIQDFTLNDLVINMEQLKLFFGDPVYYKDVDNLFKRLGSGVGTTTRAMVSDFINTRLETEFARFDSKLKNPENPVILRDTNVGTLKPVAKTLIIEDVTVGQEVQSEIKKTRDAYAKIEDEGDGGSIITLDFHREMLVRTGNWTMGPNSHEDLYQWEMQNYFSEELSPEMFEKIFGHKWEKFPQVKDSYTGELRTLKNRPRNIAFPSLKPLYYGPYAEKNVPMGLYKTSFTILLPSMVKMKDTDGELMFPNLKDTFEFMYNTETSVVSFRSSNKGITTKVKNVGTQENPKYESNQYYDNDGKLNIKNLEDTGLFQDTYTEFWGIQVETGFKSKDKSIAASQVRKQVYSNLFDRGASTIPELHKTVNDLNKINDKLAQTNKEKFLAKLGLVEKDGNYTVENLDSLKEKLIDIANNRNMPSNVVESINNMSEELGLDGVVNKDLFIPTVFSMYTSTVIQPKVKGMAAYQNPPTFFDGTSQRTKNANGTLDTVTLEFYDKNGDKPTKDLQVYVRNIYSGLNTKKLAAILKEAIAFRIPTQGLNSIESIKIKGFLPDQAGDVVVIGSGIIKKSGSDFDIDKLYMYLPNYTINSRNEPVYVKYKESDEALRADYNTYLKEYEGYVRNTFKDKLWRKFLEDRDVAMYEMPKEIKDKVNSFLTWLFDKASDIEDVADYGQFIGQKLNESFDNVADNNIKDALAWMLDDLVVEGKKLEGLIDKVKSFIDYKVSALENRTIELQRKIIKNPSNFENLIKPLDSPIFSEMADKIYGELNKGADRSRADLTDVISRKHLNSVAKRFLASKEAVGITALASTFHVLAQLHDIHVTGKYKKYDSETREYVTRSTQMNLTHNSTEGGIALGGKQTADKTEDIAYLLSLWISAAVDAAKDPYMFDLNVNLETLSAVLYMTMAGVPVEEAMYFINQPILHEYINEKEIWQNQITSNAKVPGPKGKPKSIYKSDTEIIEGLVSKYGGIALNHENTEQFKLSDLKGFKADQVNVLSDYLRYKDVSNKLRVGIQGVSYDTNSAGKNTYELLLRLFTTNKVLEDQVDGVLTLGNYNRLLSDNTGLVGFAKPFFEQTRDLLKQLSPVFKVSLEDPNLRNLIEYVTHMYGAEELNYSFDRVSKILHRLVNGYMSYHVASQQYDKSVDTYEAPENTLIESVDRLMKPGANKMTSAGQLQRLQNVFREFDKVASGKITPSEFKVNGQSVSEGIYKSLKKVYMEYRDNEFLRALVPILAKDSNKTYDHIIIRNKKLDNKTIDRYNLEWEALESSSIKEIRELASDLIKVNMLQSGLVPSPTNYMKFMPEDRYRKLLESTMKNGRANEFSLDTFLMEFMIDNSNGPDIVPANFAKGNLPFYKKVKYKEEYEGRHNPDREEAKSAGKNIYELVPLIMASLRETDADDAIINDAFDDVLFYKDFVEGINMSIFGRTSSKFIPTIEREAGQVFGGKFESQASVEELNNQYTDVLEEWNKLDTDEGIQLDTEDVKKGNEYKSQC